MSIRKGDKAKPFSLPKAPGEMVNLEEHIGREKIVLLFFPLAFSPVCTKEMGHLRDNWSKWEQVGATVYGISVDSPFVTKKFCDLERIPFPILSDFNKDVSKQYGALHDELKGLRGVSKRAAFVIDETGTVVYDWVSDDPGKEPPYEEVMAALRGLKPVAA